MIPFLRRRAMVKGLFGGSRGWTVVWAVLLGVRLVKRFTGNVPEVVLTQEIKPGEALLISGIDRDPKVLGGSQR